MKQRNQSEVKAPRLGKAVAEGCGQWESTRILDLDTVWLVKKDQVKMGSDLKPAIFQLHDGEQVNEPLQSPIVLIYWT